jgi:hypothetical protein
MGSCKIGESDGAARPLNLDKGHGAISFQATHSASLHQKTCSSFLG